MPPKKGGDKAGSSKSTQADDTKAPKGGTAVKVRHILCEKQVRLKDLFRLYIDSSYIHAIKLDKMNKATCKNLFILPSSPSIFSLHLASCLPKNRAIEYNNIVYPTTVL